MFEKILDWRARQHPTRPAIWTGSGEVTYGTLARDIARITTAFQLENLPAGVMLISGVTPALAWVLALALERLGRTTAVGAADNNDVEIIRPTVVMTPLADRKSVFGERVLHISDEWRRQAFRQPAATRRSIPNSEDVVRIILSSGTTGLRKQAPITRRVIDARIGRPLLGGPTLNLRFLQSQGCDTIGGFQHPLTVWSNGGLVMMPPQITKDMFRLQKPNLMAVSPLNLRRFLPFIKDAFSTNDRIHVRSIGSALPPPLIHQAMACEGVDLSVSYGSTEAGNIASGPASLCISRPGAVGFLAPWVDLQIVDDTGRVSPTGESGVIRIRSEGAIEGYLDSELDVGAFKDGWFYPNDLGHIDPDGVLIIDGRRDDVINLGGLKLSSARLEETILACTGVIDAAIAVLEAADGGPVMFAAIVAPNGYSAKAVHQKMRDVHKVELRLVDLPQIARNAMGKIQRSAVREAISSKISAGAS